MLRRNFLLSVAGASAAPAFLRAAELSHIDRVDRALAGKELTARFHLLASFRLPTPEEHAARTLAFHRAYRTASSR